MNYGKLSYYARKIHRLLLIFIIISGTIMMTTGTTMKYPELSFIDPAQARSIHNTVSTIFSFIFGGMMITGLIMYVTPWMIKNIQKPSPPPPLPN